MNLEKILSTGKKMISLGLLASVLAFSPSCYNQAPKKPETKPYIEQRVPTQQEPVTGELEKSRESFEEKQRLIKEKETENIEMQRYFPLAVGNTWKYKRTVSPGADVFYGKRSVIIKHDDNPPRTTTFFNVSRARKMPQFSQESYTITGIKTIPEMSEKDIYEAFFLYRESLNKIKMVRKICQVKIEGDNPRDGRYSPNSYSKLTPIGAKKNSNLMWIYANGYILEKIITNRSDTDNISDMTWSTMLYPNRTINQKENLTLIGEAELCKDSITVPAGTFSGCLENLMMIIKTDLEKKDFFERFNEGFKTHSFFAKDVGLVKEVQYDSEGNMTYTLELIEYKVK